MLESQQQLNGQAEGAGEHVENGANGNSSDDDIIKPSAEGAEQGKVTENAHKLENYD